ncbi:hypothetical protein F5141DRAFT_1203510 [Pisolithus sp. B1]|nr:hypothetical protein F5141DRAFT_1203510 [Pisolithus sp. B1]
MPSSISPLALLAPRPQIPSTHASPSTPAGHRVSGLSSLPHTPQRSPVASHIFISPPSVHRNSTDSWNSSNYDLEDPAAVWKDEEVRLLSRTLDALPAHLITPFNGPVPPSNLLDKIARGISAAKGPNDWPHTIRATRIKLLELARVKAQEERYANIHEQVDTSARSSSASKSEKRLRTPDPSEVLQQRTNTPLGVRRPLYRQSSMDFLSPVGLDKHESITRFYLIVWVSHVTLCASSSFVAQTTSDAHEDSAQGAVMGPTHILKSKATAGTEGYRKVERTKAYGEGKVQSSAPVVPATPSKSKMPTKTGSSKKPRVSGTTKKAHPTGPAVDGPAMPRTLPLEARAVTEEKSTPSSVPSPPNARKARKGHKPQLSLSSDEEYQERSKTAKKLRTREPSWTALLASPLPAQPLFVSPHAAARPKPLSMAGKAQDPKSDVRARLQSPNEKKPARRNLIRNPSMFGPELPNPQKTPESPARIPLSSPRVISPPTSPTSTLPVTPAVTSTPSLSPVCSRPRTLRRAARRIEFGNVPPSPKGDTPNEISGNTMLGSAFQLG